MSLAEDLDALQARALNALDEVSTPSDLEDWRVTFLARKGELAGLIAQLGAIPADQRRDAGQAVNRVKESLQTAYEQRNEALAMSRTESGAVQDVTLPGIPPVVGGLHVIRQTLYEMIRIFTGMGFTVFETNEVETDEYNFQLLNLPPDHPARDMQDTFYISDELLLRTHTSPGQIRAMHEYCPQPIRALLPGKVHRYEALSARAESMFYQVEGLVVGKGITLANLKGVFEAYTRQLYGPDRQLRFRGSYFPFTEPSVEIDMTCNCAGAGCPLCKGTGWLEISGGGMVHPTVLRNGGYDPDQVTGFAFGMGIDRQALLLYNIDDIRLFYGNDLRFLQQFN